MSRINRLGWIGLVNALLGLWLLLGLYGFRLCILICNNWVLSLFRLVRKGQSIYHNISVVARPVESDHGNVKALSSVKLYNFTMGCTLELHAALSLAV